MQTCVSLIFWQQNHVDISFRHFRNDLDTVQDLHGPKDA